MIFRRFIISGNSEPRLPSCTLAILGLLVAGWSPFTAESQQQDEGSSSVALETTPTAVVMGPDDGDHLWVFAESKDKLGSGGEFQIYVDPVNFPQASASFAKFALGVGGALPVHRHDKTEEIGYFLSGEGVVTVYEDGNPKDIPVRAGYVTYIPPGSWHTIKNTGQEPFTLVFATIPNDKNGLLSFFRRIGAEPGEVATPLNPEDFARIASEHDMILRPVDADEE
ncbi:MAG: cupin domain-containing protein [Thermoanaerobaculia bacterium]